MGCTPLFNLCDWCVATRPPKRQKGKDEAKVDEVGAGSGYDGDGVWIIETTSKLRALREKVKNAELTNLNIC